MKQAHQRIRNLLRLLWLHLLRVARYLLHHHLLLHHLLWRHLLLHHHLLLINQLRMIHLRI